MLRYASIDVETTGLDPHRNQVLEIAVVVETDWGTAVEDLPFLRLVLRHEHVFASWRALEMNARLFRGEVDASGDLVARHPPGPAAHHLLTFLRDQFGYGVGRGERVTAAGKNFATFDKLFLERLPGWPRGVFRHRVLDPVTLWVDSDDGVPPDLETCLDRANLKPSGPHTALGDARDVIRLIRAGLNYA